MVIILPRTFVFAWVLNGSRHAGILQHVRGIPNDCNAGIIANVV